VFSFRLCVSLYIYIYIYVVVPSFGAPSQPHVFYVYPHLHLTPGLIILRLHSTMCDTPIKSELNFLSRDSLYETEKPYSLRFTPPLEDDDPNSSPPPARHNLNTCKVQIDIHDARPLDPRLEEHGFALTHVPTSMTYKDFSDHDKIESVYAKELQEHLKGLLVGARHVRVIDYVVGILRTFILLYSCSSIPLYPTHL
jgi:hypothetical protein